MSPKPAGLEGASSAAFAELLLGCGQRGSRKVARASGKAVSAYPGPLCSGNAKVVDSDEYVVKKRELC